MSVKCIRSAEGISTRNFAFDKMLMSRHRSTSLDGWCGRVRCGGAGRCSALCLFRDSRDRRFCWVRWSGLWRTSTTSCYQIWQFSSGTVLTAAMAMLLAATMRVMMFVVLAAIMVLMMSMVLMRVMVLVVLAVVVMFVLAVTGFL